MAILTFIGQVAVLVFCVLGIIGTWINELR